MISYKTKAHGALLIGGLIFGANYWIAKELMPDPLLPRQIIFIRVFIAAIVFSILSLTIKPDPVKRKDLLIIALSSLLGVTTNQIFFFEGLNLTTPVDASILHATCPIFVLVFATLIIREKVVWINVLGVIIGAAGTVLLITSGAKTGLFKGGMLGNVFILINNSAYAMYLVMIKPMMEKYHPLTVMKWVFIFGFAGVAPLAFNTMLKTDLHVLRGTTLLSLIYVVLGTTLFAYLLTIYGLKYLKASVAGYYIYLQPVMAAVIGLIWFAGTVTVLKVLAAICIFGGVYLVNRRKKPSLR